MAAAIPLLLALTWGGMRYPWLSMPIAALVVASAVAVPEKLKKPAIPVVPARNVLVPEVVNCKLL